MFILFGSLLKIHSAICVLNKGFFIVHILNIVENVCFCDECFCLFVSFILVEWLLIL